MFDWLADIFNEDTFKTIVNGANTAGSIFNQLSPIINTGAQLALGLEGTGNAKAFNEANRAAQARLDSLFSPTGDYAQELRNQLERKDAAAGRRSQYGTRETELMSKLAKEKASVLTSPAYANFLRNQFISPYAPIAGAVGNLTGGLTGAGQPGTTQQPGQAGRPGTPAPSGLSEAGQYLYNMFGPGAEASIASLGGAGSALAGANTPAALGVVDSLGSMLGGTPFLPGYSSGATGIFGPALGGATEAIGSTAGGSTLGDAAADAGLGLVGGLGDVIGAGLGGAGSALSGMGAGSLAGTVGGLDSLGALAGGTGFLPGYAGTGATGIFGGGVGGASGLSGAGGGAAAGGGSSAAAGGLAPWMGAALPAAVLLGGLASMFQQGTQPIDITKGWQANAGGLNQGNFNQFSADDPTLNAIIGLSKDSSGNFNLDAYNQAISKATVGGKRFEGEALNQAQQFGQTLAQNPSWMQGPAATEEAWWSPYAQGTPSN